jgi:putative ABC transport system permease protein
MAGLIVQPVLRAVTSSAARRAGLPVDFLNVAGLSAHTGGSTQMTGAGVVVGMPPGYAATFPGEVRPLVGSGTGVVLAQQTAANLHAAPGDQVTVVVRDAASATFRVDGVVDLPYADSLFQKVSAPSGAQPSAPPDNVLILPTAAWHHSFDGLASSRPELVEQQIHVRLSRHLPADPAAAFSTVTAEARRLELTLTEAGFVGNNLGAALDSARSDALYAQVLFLLLGVLGALLAAGPATAVVSSGAERRRQEQALLRTRGATRRQMVRLAASEAGMVGGVGAAAGLGRLR